MNTNKKSYCTPTTDMRLLTATCIICGSGGYSVSGDVVSGGNSGADPGAGGM